MQPEKLFSSVYQDVYRLHYGVIFLVNFVNRHIDYVMLFRYMCVLGYICNVK